MKNRIYACIVGVIALSGCAKFLEDDNRGGITNDEFYRTEACYRSIVYSSYATLRTTFGRQAPWLLLGGTDIYQMNREQANRALMEYTQLFADNGDVLTFYRNCYEAIQNINIAIFYNDITEVRSEEHTSELQS